MLRALSLMTLTFFEKDEVYAYKHQGQLDALTVRFLEILELVPSLIV